MNDTPSPAPGRTIELAEEVAARLRGVAQECGVSPTTVVLAGFALLTRRYTGEQSPSFRHGGGSVHMELAHDGRTRDLWSMLRPCPSTGADEVAVHLGPDLCRLTVEGMPDGYADDFLADLAELLATVDPDQSTRDVLPVARYERRRAPDIAPLHGGDGTQGDAIRGRTIAEAFAATVAAHPERPAVLADDGSVTYRELGSAVAATAAALPAGQGPVAVLCRHGVATITGILAALAAGSPYVPLDEVFPALRLATMLRDAAVLAIITDPAHADLAAHLVTAAGLPGTPIVHLRQSTSDVDLTALRGVAAPDDPAYILYTSGSTGAPKGVVQSHRNVLFGVTNHVCNFAIRPDDRTSVLTSFGYDMAVTDTFSALLSGAAAVPVDVRTHGLGHLADALADRSVTIYHSTPTVYRYLVASLGDNGRLPGIRAVLLGGEEVTRHDVALARRAFAPGAVFVNGYGTTEISFAAQNHLPPDAALEQSVVPIGHPLPGIDVALVDVAGRTTCLTGEIVVRTPHVALGYLGLPDLTAARFGEHGGVRTYRTGDLARRLPDGRLVYLGRGDRMVKIRGYRVELGEIEAQLAGLPGVAQAAVVARPSPTGRGTGEQEIIGYVVAASGTRAGRLREELASVLPEFMVPRAVAVVDELPIGPTGKLDHAALPDPPAAGVSPSRWSAGRAGPAPSEHAFGPIEHTITASWCEVLGLATVDRHANFFELGGHSLQLAMIQQRLEERLDRRVPLARLVEFPTVAALAGHLGTVTAHRDGVPTDARLAHVEDRMRRRRAAHRGESERGVS